MDEGRTGFAVVSSRSGILFWVLMVRLKVSGSSSLLSPVSVCSIRNVGYHCLNSSDILRQSLYVVIGTPTFAVGGVILGVPVGWSEFLPSGGRSQKLVLGAGAGMKVSLCLVLNGDIRCSSFVSGICASVRNSLLTGHWLEVAL